MYYFSLVIFICKNSRTRMHFFYEGTELMPVKIIGKMKKKTLKISV